MRKPNYEVVAADVRPGRPDGTCFYCQAALGTEHKEGCVLRTKAVVVEATFRFIAEVPDDWEGEDIKNFPNKSGHSGEGDGCAICAFNTINGLIGPMLQRGLTLVREATVEDELKFIVPGETQGLVEVH